MWTWLGSLALGIWTWFLDLLGSANSQKQADQIAKDATTIQGLKDMDTIDAQLATESTDAILSGLRADTSARTPKP